MRLLKVEPPLDDTALGDLVYAGTLLVFSKLPPIREMCRLSRRYICEELGSRTPVKVHEAYPPAEFLARVQRLQMRYTKDARLKRLFSDALSQIGIDIEQSFWDKLLLRVLPPSTMHQRGELSYVGAHRDTWGVGIHQQINWWAPIFPVAKNRTMCIYPDHWQKRLKNTTATWQMETYTTERKKKKSGYAPAYPSAPQALEQPQEEGFKPVIKPGDLLCFSAAHLHSSIPNSSAFTRFSFEIRTVNLHDLKTGKGAPNVDCASRGQRFGLFRNMVSEEKLADRC